MTASHPPRVATWLLQRLACVLDARHAHQERNRSNAVLLTRQAW